MKPVQRICVVAALQHQIDGTGIVCYRGPFNGIGAIGFDDIALFRLEDRIKVFCQRESSAQKASKNGRVMVKSHHEYKSRRVLCVKSKYGREFRCQTLDAAS